MGQDSEPRASSPRDADPDRLRVLSWVVPALAHRINNALMAVVGLGDLRGAAAEPELMARLAATAGGQGETIGRAVRALSDFCKPILEGARASELRPVLDAAEALLGPLAEARATQLAVRAPDEIATEVDTRALLQALVTLGADALADEGSRLRIRVQRTAAVWRVDLLGTLAGRVHGLPAGWSARERGRLARLRLELPALGEQGAGDAATHAGATGCSLLVLEPDAELAELVHTVLGEGGHRPSTFSDVDGWIEAARSESFDLALISVGDGTRDQLAALELVDRLRPHHDGPLGLIGPQALAPRLGVETALERGFRPGELLDYVRALTA